MFVILPLQYTETFTEMEVSIQFENIRCVTLDLDDTLWPVEPTIVKAESELYEWLKQNYPRVCNTYTQHQLTQKRMVLQANRKDISHNVTELRYCSLLEIGDEFGYDKSFANQAMALFRFYRNQVVPYEFSESVVSTIKQHYILGAVTNGNAQLDQIPIGKYFDFVVTAEQAGVCKPDPGMFESASKLANVPLAKILHIGDSAKTDVLGAMNAGCKAIWFNSKRLPWPGGQNPHHVVHCLTEIPKVLKI